MHSVSFADVSKYTYNIKVDGKQITLTRMMNPIQYGDTTALAILLDDIEACIYSGNGFTQIKGRITGANLLRILEVLHYDETITTWMKFRMTEPRVRAEESFKSFFGYFHNIETVPSAYAKLLYDLAKDEQKRFLRIKKAENAIEKSESLIFCNKARTGESSGRKSATISKNQLMVTVQQTGSHSNIITYDINGKSVEMCVSGHKELADAHFVAYNISLMESGLRSLCETDVQSSIHAFGGKAALTIMESCFPDTAISFFVSRMNQRVKEEREHPCTVKLLKHYFGGSSGQEHTFKSAILDALENEIPKLEDYLVRTSPEELLSSRIEWRLFFFRYSHLENYIVRFPPSDLLAEELRQFYASMAQQYLHSGKDYCRVIYEKNTEITRVLSFMDTTPTSLLDISVWMVRKAEMRALEEGIGISSLRKSLYSLKRAISFFDAEKAKIVVPKSVIADKLLRPTAPLGNHAIQSIVSNYEQMPLYTRLVFQTLAETGARIESVCLLTTDCLFHQDGKWILRIYYAKAEGNHHKDGMSSIVNHELSPQLGEELHAYIEDTQSLRSSMNKPFIFVYSKERTRANSKRRPVVITPNSYYTSMEKYCRRTGVTDYTGLNVTASARRIRAEVGRRLFADGKTASEVAAKLNNTEAVAMLHYNKMTPKDEAQHHREYFEETLDLVMDGHKKKEEIYENNPNYGTCDRRSMCGNQNDCRVCPERIGARGEK